MTVRWPAAAHWFRRARARIEADRTSLSEEHRQEALRLLARAAFLADRRRSTECWAALEAVEEHLWFQSRSDLVLQGRVQNAKRAMRGAPTLACDGLHKTHRFEGLGLRCTRCGAPRSLKAECRVADALTRLVERFDQEYGVRAERQGDAVLLRCRSGREVRFDVGIEDDRPVLL